jgi:hypothetical protein
MTRSILITVAGGLFVSACNEPAHLQRSYGEAYSEAFTQQADLTRPAAAEAGITLTGEEGVALRQRVAESTSDTEKGETVEE